MRLIYLPATYKTILDRLPAIGNGLREALDAETKSVVAHDGKADSVNLCEIADAYATQLIIESGKDSSAATEGTFFALFGIHHAGVKYAMEHNHDLNDIKSTIVANLIDLVDDHDRESRLDADGHVVKEDLMPEQLAAMEAAVSKAKMTRREAIDADEEESQFLSGKLLGLGCWMLL